MAELRKSYSNYVLRRKRQLTSKGAVYERDWMTVSEMDGFAPGTRPVYASGNFKLTINNERGGKKKYSFSDWYLNENGDTWNLSMITEEQLKVKSQLIKPNYTSLLDFAHYGSAVELIRGTVNDIIMRYPAEIYVTREKYLRYFRDDDYIELTGGTIVENPFQIDLTTRYVRADRVDNPYRYMFLSWDKYEVVIEDESGNTIAVAPVIGWDPGTPVLPDICYNNGDEVFSDARLYIDYDCSGGTSGSSGSRITGWKVSETEIVIPLGNDSHKYYPKLQTMKKSVHEYNNPDLNITGYTVGGGEVHVDQTGYVDGETAYVPLGNSSTKYQAVLSGLTKSMFVLEDGIYQINTELPPLGEVTEAYIPLGNDSGWEGRTREDGGLVGYNRRLLHVTKDVHDYGGPTASTESQESVELIPFVYLDPKLPTDCASISFSGIWVNGKVYLVSNQPGWHVKLQDKYIDEIFESFDDFEKVLLNRDTKPKYKAKFMTPRETDRGVIEYERYYIWPTLTGGWNLDFETDAYASYVEGLLYIASYYDEIRTDNIWRSYTHESIKNFDWTTPRETYVPEIDGHLIDTERLEAILKVGGRQFDDLKRYIENIRFTVNVSYDSKNNMPDIALAKFLEMAGWEVKNVAPTTDNSIVCVEDYPGIYVKNNAEEANNEFLKRMILNSRNILSKKGTRAGIEAVYAMFGIFEKRHNYNESGTTEGGTHLYYTIDEYNAYARNYITGSEEPTAQKSEFDKVFEMNAQKDGFLKHYDRTMDDLCGLMAKYAFNSDTGVKYIVPWYDRYEVYDNYPYYQMLGGWGKRARKNIVLPDIAPNIHEIFSDDNLTIYDETVKNVKVVENFTDLNRMPIGFLKEGDIYYVLSLSEAYETYGCSDISGDSHYVFFTGATSFARTVPYNDEYKWCLVNNSEFNVPTSALTWYAKKIIYIESLHDNSLGNNPHNGNAIYDGGKEYFEYYDQLFKGALETDMFTDYRSRIAAENAKRHHENRFRANKLPDLVDETSGITGTGFNVLIDVSSAGTIDNNKIWYFTNEEDSGLGYAGHEMYKRTFGDTGAYTALGLNDFKLVTLEHEFWNKPIQDTGSTITQEAMTLDIPGSIMESTGREDQHYSNGYAVINTKNIRITYHLPWELEDYVTDVVEFYVKQVIPSTVITEFVWDYTDGERPPQTAKYASIKLTPSFQNIGGNETEADINIHAYGVENVGIYNERTENI